MANKRREGNRKSKGTSGSYAHKGERIGKGEGVSAGELDAIGPGKAAGRAGSNPNTQFAATAKGSAPKGMRTVQDGGDEV